MNRQLFYNIEDIDNYYLSPYDRVIPLSRNRLFITRYDTGKSVTMGFDTDVSRKLFLDTLQNGVSKKGFISLFSGDQTHVAENILSLLLKNGIME